MEIILCIAIFFLLFFHMRNIFKISYYETKLKNRNINVDIVKNMPVYKLWVN